MIALGGPKLKQRQGRKRKRRSYVSMIALGGPKLKRMSLQSALAPGAVSMIALGGPKLKLAYQLRNICQFLCFNDSTGWA